jgi:hypothetical protein
MNNIFSKYLCLSLILLGIILIIASQFFIWQTDHILAIVDQMLGSSWQLNQMWYEILPNGIVFGIAIFLLGSIFLALALQSYEIKKDPIRSELLFSFYQRHIFITGIILIAASVFLMLPAKPETFAAVFWLITLIFFGAIFMFTR